MVKIENLSKKYGVGAGNLKINLSIKEGEVYGLVGPNGAGKTTLIRQIMGFVKPDEGAITINDLVPWTQRDTIMAFTGYVAGEIALAEHMKGITFLKLCASLKDNVDWDFVERLIIFFELEVDKKIKKMSKGMKQKLAIIAATMNKPKFLVLDEPTSGLDPIMQEKFNSLIEELLKKNTTILICSHIFSEIALLANRVGIINHGKLIDEFDMKDNDLNYLNERFKTLFKEVIKI
ncbi:ABC transporter ATP-binding protein [Spiroplasma culicicola]|uniref:ABC transporter ATP-binding protein n=1 Tax=Spiroplasma culicicola AES-1 TaxID=1276246 RepID=W6A6C4_9MOLU|nr:ATP-binding cassette domain-containing protein [Spiroplasma culicicola]AHI52506.1 ABC transporter ATP-binding protein [Spiroplasma culicicola AES-1]